MLKFSGQKQKSIILLLVGVISLVLVLGYGVTVSAENESPWLDKDEVTDNRLEEQREKFLQERGWELGVSKENPNNAYLGWGYSNIKASPGNKHFGQSRILAFEDAYVEAKGGFIRTRRSEIITETVSEFVMDEMPEPDVPPENRREYLAERADIAFEKAMDLGEAQLNELLREFDIDPDEYQEAERVERKEILQDSISRSATTRAVESAAGLIVEATFEDNNGIGVLVKHSHETENIARQIATREPVQLGPNYNPRKHLEEDLRTLSEENAPFVYGVRIMENNEGENVLVAFGQWSPAVTKTTQETLAEARIKSARDLARSRAEAALTEFVNSTVVFENITEVVEEEQMYEEAREGRVQQMEDYRIGEYVETVVEQYGQVELEGISTIDTWTTNHVQTGHLLVGHIVKWSPSSRDAIRGDFAEDEVTEEEEDKEEEDEGEVIESPF